MGAATYKMIAIDLDGTLLSPQGKVTERTKAAIHKCLSAGMLVCFATGKDDFHVPEKFAKLWGK